MSKEVKSALNLAAEALCHAVDTIDGLPKQQQERSDQKDMIRILVAIKDGEFPVGGKSITGRDGLIVCKALAYTVITGHEDKEDMKQLLERIAKGGLGADYYIDNAMSHVYGLSFNNGTKH
jgi:hypothetical protein